MSPLGKRAGTGRYLCPGTSIENKMTLCGELCAGPGLTGVHMELGLLGAVLVFASDGGASGSPTTILRKRASSRRQPYLCLGMLRPHVGQKKSQASGQPLQDSDRKKSASPFDSTAQDLTAKLPRTTLLLAPVLCC